MTRSVESGCWAFAVIAMAMAAWSASVATPEPMPPSFMGASAIGPVTLPPDSIGARVLRAVARDPFRLARTPSPVPFGAPSLIAAVAQAPIAVPALQLRGIVGPPWRAVLEGEAAGEAGRLVRAGDSIGGASIVSVRTGAVTLRTRDTTWTLQMRRP